MMWWQTALISLGISLLTAFISFLCVNIYNSKGALKFYITRLFTSEKYFHCMLTVYNPSRIPKLYQNMFLCLFNKRKLIEEVQLETSSPDRRNSLGEIQCYYVEPCMIEPRGMIKLVVSCSIKHSSETKLLKIKYNNHKNKIKYYKIKKYKSTMANELTGGKINF